MAAANKPSENKKVLSGYVGFANLPNQVHRRSVKRGFEFTLMVVGESGLGKSTLINTLFNTLIYPAKQPQALSNEIVKTVSVQPISVDIEENGIKLKLTIIDTPGFGDFINNEDSWKPILDNIESRYDAFLEQESRVNRKKAVDNRIHACIYFIAPTGHSLKPLDLEFMRRLHKKVNIIPVIAKADTLTEEEVKAFKERIKSDIATHEIDIYNFPDDEEDDAETRAENLEMRKRMPFAVVASTEEVESNGKKVRGRKYPWGVIEVDNDDHNDFTKLRQLLIWTHMEDLRDHTNHVLYENYRSKKLAEGGITGGNELGSSLGKFDEERVNQEAKMKKMEEDMRNVFLEKVQEKEQKLKQSEDELNAEYLRQKEQIELKKRELEEKRQRLESLRPGTPEKKPRKKLFS